MTDKECLMQLIKNLKLINEDNHLYPYSNEFRISNNEIRIGSGNGYMSFYAEFKFDEHGNVIEHGVWE